MATEVLSDRAVLATLMDRLDRDPGGWAGEVGMLFRSTQEIETYKWLGQSPQMREWRGNRMAQSLRDSGITLKNLPYEATLDIHEDDLRRDKFGQIQRRIGQLATNTNAHWAQLVSALINAGKTGLGYDGVAFFAATHSEGDSGTLSNLLTASDYTALDVAVPAVPTAQEMAGALVAMLTHFATFKDDQGEPINENASRFLVMVPPMMLGTARIAVSANTLTGSTGSEDNPVRQQVANIVPVPNVRLTSTTEITMYRTDAEDKPFILQEDQAVRATAKGYGSEYAHDTKHHQYGVDATRAAGYGLWQYAMHATFS